jgi:D-beta-D-heptose 7-phosphate kinase/D-beta-D-heptose 1-phosphate adenosyltransferase
MFDELTPYNIISKLKPDILVKGGDYNITDIVGHDLVSKTIIINFEDGFSTTSILNKLKT